VTAYYVDTSALIKRYVDELGSDWMRARLTSPPVPSIICVYLVVVEVTSALTRRVREGGLSRADYAQVQRAFRTDCIEDYDLVIATNRVIGRANYLLEQHPLRAFDAVHLATALLVNSQLRLHDLDPLVFLSADERLNAAAAEEGLAVDNPNHHPSL
jgi:uncharacterized protein